MKSMFIVCFGVLFPLLSSKGWASDKIAVSHVVETSGQRGLIVIEIENEQLKTAVQSRLLELFPGEVLSVKSPNSPLILPDKKPFMSKDKAGRDLCIGGALCAGGIGLVAAAGKERSSPPSGVYAQVGDKYVSGGGACVVGAMWISGAFFIVKGFFELLMTDKGSESSSIRNEDFNHYAQLQVKARRDMQFEALPVHEQEILVVQEVLKYRQLPSSKVFNLLAR
jgi:hypothetical protein